MKLTRKSTLNALLAILLLAAAAPGILAGANETPGESYKPHRYGYFSANLWEFGTPELAKFNKYVVGDQHYTQGAAYSDATNDLTTGGAGIWNYFKFCSDRRHDVMFMTSHGWNTPTTSIEQYPPTAAGLAARDSVYTYYSAIFGAEKLFKRNWIRGNGTVRSYHLDVTQAFYTAYFQTPQAFAWWSTCWSSLMSMTGATEARAYVGYDNVVAVSKCLCDEEKILSRMDGQEGQAKRPLAAASAGINGFCPPGGARLQTAGKLNTTLSPSVTGNAPTGIVCAPTPGHVSFDTSMDTTVPPATVVVAYGGGVLINHAWAGDDRITFDVIPIVPWPVIFYDVIESKARSKADRARLDGNTSPVVNAKGPNRDDYVWVTVCPYNGPPWTPHVPSSNPVPVIPGDDRPITTALASNTPEPKTITCTLTDALGWYTGEERVVTIAGEGAHALVIWDIDVPAGILPGTTNVVTMTATDGETIQSVEAELLYSHPLSLSFFDPPIVRSNEATTLRIQVRNDSPIPIELNGLQIFDDAGWAQPLPPLGYEIDAFGEMEASIEIGPVELFPGDSSTLRWQGMIDGVDVGGVIGEIFAGLPLVTRLLEAVGFVPGNPNATLRFGIENRSAFDIPITYLAFDAFGFPVVVNCPQVLPGQQEILCEIHVDIPPDAALIGQDGWCDFAIVGEDGFEFVTRFAYSIGSGVSARLLEPEISMTTGHAVEQLFAHQVELTNLSALPMQGNVLLATAWPGVPPVQNFYLPPYATQFVSFNLMVLPDMPAETQPGLLDVHTDSGLGDSQQEIYMTLYEPVIVQMGEKGIAGEGGDHLSLEATLHNLRWDAPMEVEYLWTDEKGWLNEPLGGFLPMLPNSAESLQVFLDLPGGLVAYADSNEVTLLVTMTYDTGLIAQSHGSIQVMVLGDDGVTGVPGSGGVPVLNRLAGNFPNPFNPRTQVRFTLAEPGEIRLFIYDVRGSRVKRLADGLWPAGSHELRWDGDDDSGEGVASGVYFIRLEMGREVQTSKAVLVR